MCVCVCVCVCLEREARCACAASRLIEGSMSGPSDSSYSAEGFPSAENSADPDTKGRESHVGVPGGPGGKKN